MGPVYRSGRQGEPELLAACYRNSLHLAVERGLKTIAFPCISTGVYGYPKEAAARIALKEVEAFLVLHPDFEKVIMVCFGREDESIYWKLLQEEKKGQM